MVTRTRTCDVLVAGAGPAGLASAIALRLRGADVLVADARQPPIDKPCGEGLMPEACHALDLLGVPTEDYGVPFSGIVFANEKGRASADFRNGPGRGLRRTMLHQLLWERARALGVRLADHTPVEFHPNQPPALAGEQVAARWVIGADGASSRARTWAKLDRCRIHSHRYGFRTHFLLAPEMSPPTHVEVHWGRHGQAYITPTAKAGLRAEICVTAMTHDPAVRLRAILDTLPSLRELLRGAQLLPAERGCVTTTRSLQRVTRGNVALIGDASGSIDAITGEGLALAFRQALLLAESLATGGLAIYEAGHPALLRLPNRMARLLLLLDRHPQLRERTLGAFAGSPALFEALLAVHVGQLPLSRFVVQHGAALGARILWPMQGARFTAAASSAFSDDAEKASPNPDSAEANVRVRDNPGRWANGLPES